ncbi:hypothetical protein C882_1046 [Caenispirillum salinarum AK4]|uniref:Uncharacterized protein n=1 Tax=Caenispirillum salinarum AK4 TaxID=1238182 RepID=K9GQ08_9PROT|nr:hypothetical protein C882_1046 [Caenispirillum salinarum AK4]
MQKIIKTDHQFLPRQRPQVRRDKAGMEKTCDQRRMTGC